MNRVLICSAGTRPKKELLWQLKNWWDGVIACDGGANYLRELGIKPSLVMGDFDSAAGGIFPDDACILTTSELGTANIP